MKSMKMALVNASKSIVEFENGIYICPNTKEYSFAYNRIFDYLAGYAKKQVRYMGKIVARATIEKRNGELYFSYKDVSGDAGENIDEKLLETYKNAQKIGVYDRDSDLEKYGCQVFLLKDVECVNIDYVHRTVSWSKFYIELKSKNEFDYEYAVEKVKNQALDLATSKVVDLDKLITLNVPEQFLIRSDIAAATETSRKLLFCNIAWMDKYEGVEDKKMKSGGSYVREHGYGGEMYNFKPVNDRCYGYVRSVSSNEKEDEESTINISRISGVTETNYVDNIDVVWLGNNPEDGLGTRIVGYYKNAKVYANLQERPTESASDFKYIIDADKNDCFCIPAEYRKFEIPRKTKGFLGQSNVWYADSENEDVIMFKNAVYEYISGIAAIESYEKSNWVIPCDINKYDVHRAFSENKILEWTQSPQLNNMKVGDTVYIYVGKPFGRIMYQCQVLNVNIAASSIDDAKYVKDDSFFEKDRRLFKIKLIKKLGDMRLSLVNLNEKGLSGNIQGPRKLKDAIKDFVNDVCEQDKGQTIEDNDIQHEISGTSEELVELALNSRDELAGYKYLETVSKYRVINQKLIRELKDIYKGQCQMCGNKIGDEYGEEIAEAHHIEYFSLSQNNDQSNILIVCPNCHSIIHRCNPIFDRTTSCYEFANGIKKKLLNPGHLIVN